MADCVRRRWRSLALVGAIGLVMVLALSLGLGWRWLMRADWVTVSGTVTDGQTGQPIAHARVDDNRYGAGARQAPRQTWTDVSGRYQLQTADEEHTLAASAPGYETQLATLMTKPFGATREARIDFRLRAKPEAGAVGAR